MSFRAFSLATILTQMLLGGLCMMPMAMASEADGAPMAHHDMGSMDEEQQDGGGNFDCGTGHCIMHAMPSPMPGVAAPDACPAAPAPIVSFVPSIVDDAPVPTSAAPPGNGIQVKTIVMRM